MKKKNTKTKRKQKNKQEAQPIKVCLMSINSYLDSYLTALDSVNARR